MSDSQGLRKSDRHRNAFTNIDIEDEKGNFVDESPVFTFAPTKNNNDKSMQEEVEEKKYAPAYNNPYYTKLFGPDISNTFDGSYPEDEDMDSNKTILDPTTNRPLGKFAQLKLEPEENFDTSDSSLSVPKESVKHKTGPINLTGEAALDMQQNGGYLSLKFLQDLAKDQVDWLKLHFTKPLPIVPTVIYGFRAIEASAANSPRVALNLSSVSETGISLSLNSFLHPTSNLETSVMALPNGTIPFQHGYVDASDNPGGRSAGQNASIAVTFKKPFKAPPKVLVWFTEISQPHGWRSLWTYASNVTETGLTVNIETWCEREFEAARVSCLAWPAEFDGKTIRSWQHVTFTKDQEAMEGPWYRGSFSKDPKMFTAIDWIDIPDTQPSGSIGIYAKHKWATKDKLRWQAGVSDSTDCIKIGMCWLAIE
ncbi:hypothetical protein IL306_000743 [Fusarium sp. DS 682]|nr:hypothetical protein IL306_000743 [Fusarium sp. DS 682]